MAEKGNKPLMVSIRCITYNHEPYIRQCLDGFVMQRTNFRFEAIVHDDASTDKTADIIREYAEKYPDIIKPILETENQYSKHDGTIQRIMKAAMHGKYVALCEGDDYWTDPYKLQKQVDFLEAHPDYSMCCHNVERVRSGKRISVVTNVRDNTILSPESIIRNDGGYIATNSIMYVRELIIPFLLEFSKGMPVGDFPLQILAGLKGKVYCMKDIMSAYRTDNMTSWTNSHKSNTAIVNLYSTEVEWLKKTNINTELQYNECFKYIIGKYKFLISILQERRSLIFRDADFRYYWAMQPWYRRLKMFFQLVFIKVLY